jgi:hypothetical protein
MFKEMLEFTQVVFMLQEAKDIKFAILSLEGPKCGSLLKLSLHVSILWWLHIMFDALINAINLIVLMESKLDPFIKG